MDSLLLEIKLGILLTKLNFRLKLKFNEVDTFTYYTAIAQHVLSYYITGLQEQGIL